MTLLTRVMWGIGQMLWPAAAVCLFATFAYGADGVRATATPSLVQVCAWYLLAAVTSDTTVMIGIGLAAFFGPVAAAYVTIRARQRDSRD